jgi:formylglycine-generating enzyme required for sulfatase activity
MGLWVRRLLPMAAALTAIPLMATASYGQLCTSDSLRQAIAQLPNSQNRANAQTTLKQCGEGAVQPLASALNVDDTITRRYAAETLGQIGQEAKSAVPALVRVSQGDGDPQIRGVAVLALSAIGKNSQADSSQLQGWQIGKIQDLKDLQQQLNQALTALKQDQTDSAALKQWPTKIDDLNTLRLTTDALQTQLDYLTDRPTYRVISWGQSHLRIVLIMAGAIAVITIYGTVFWLRPLWLLKWGDGAIQAIAKIPHVGSALSGVLKALLPLKYHPHVLDAWVNQHIGNVREKLLEHPTIQRHDIHITQPVFLRDNPEPINFEPEQFAGIFKNKFRLLIRGEGGAGKTSLACRFTHWAMWGRVEGKGFYQDDPSLIKRLCQHRMIPVLIEEALGEKSLLDTIDAQLKELTGADEISNKLLQKLLQERRVLVIVDHLSEITDESTRQKIRPSQNQDYPVNALIVTSRDPEILGAEAVTLVQPGRITTENHADFLNRYLPEKQKREGVTVTFNPNDYASSYKDLGEMISLRQAAETKQGQQLGATILLVTLYADQMIVEKQKREKFGKYYYTTQQNLANNVPDLMLNYLDALNNKDASQAFPGGLMQPQEKTLKLHKIAQVVAWKCLEQNYKPESVSRERVIEALIDLESQFQVDKPKELANQDLDYLAKLSLIQFQSKDRTVRLSLDPLAEYLAALYKFWEYQSDQTVWMPFLEQVETRVNPNDVRGFLLALYDCCDQKGRGKPIEIPDQVLEKLVELTQLDQTKIDTYYRERRMRLALEDLQEHDPMYQSRAIADLTTIAHEDQTLRPSALRCLTEVFKDKNRLAQVRREAGEALGKVGIGAEDLLSCLSDPTEDLMVRRSAAAVLGWIKAGASGLLEILENNDQPLSLRQETAHALSLIGAPSGEPVPMLIVELQQGEAIAQVKPIPILKEKLTEDLTLELVTIPAGEFLMGSPLDEEERNWYWNHPYYSETQGLDVEKQHPVTVSSFLMSQHPITQAQWRFVAQLSKINRDLDPDPANFKGDRHPIETVSWHDAIEFCARLSQHTGKTYRLPSEAEWEYTCRAGTVEPFHLGATLSTDFANYNGDVKYTYGNGVEGVFQNKTTEVGSFGIVNAFGLSDMHGNVWEWCLDHWHLSYEGAPIDGSAWVVDGDDRYRLLRGGSWYYDPGYCRSAYRNRGSPHLQNNNYGFRVVCVPPWTL